MASETMILTLAKVLIAAAWADGELSNDEINSMKDVLFHLPDLNSRQWAAIEMYMESPVDEPERQRLVDELRRELDSVESQQMALAALDDLIRADGAITPEEERTAARIRAAIESADVGFVGQLARIFRSASGRRAEAAAGAPNREDYFEDYIKNRVYYDLRLRLDQGEGSLDLPEEDLRKLSLAGGMMAKIAGVQAQITGEELATMAAALQEHWRLTGEQARFVAEVAASSSATDLDYFRLSRQFASVSSYEERIAFMNVLFAIAAADGEISRDEFEEIRNIAGALKIPHSELVAARLEAG